MANKFNSGYRNNFSYRRHKRLKEAWLHLPGGYYSHTAPAFTQLGHTFQEGLSFYFKGRVDDSEELGVAVQ